MAQQQYHAFSGLDGWISAWFNLCCCTSVCVKCRPWRNEWAAPRGERYEGQQKWRVGKKMGKSMMLVQLKQVGRELYTPTWRWTLQRRPREVQLVKSGAGGNTWNLWVNKMVVRNICSNISLQRVSRLRGVYLYLQTLMQEFESNKITQLCKKW